MSKSPNNNHLKGNVWFNEQPLQYYPSKRSFSYPPLQCKSISALAMHPDQRTVSEYLNVVGKHLLIHNVTKYQLVGTKKFELVQELHSIEPRAKYVHEQSMIVVERSTFMKYNLIRIDLNENCAIIKWRFPLTTHVENKWCIDVETDQLFVSLGDSLKVLSLHDGMEVARYDLPLKQLSCLEINSIDSNELIAVSHTRAEISYVDKRSFQIRSTINVESQMLSILKKSMVFNVKCMTQDRRGQLYLAIHWYSPAMKAHSGIYDSSFYLVTLNNDRIISIEEGLVNFYTNTMEIDSTSKLLFIMKNQKELWTARLKDVTLFDTINQPFSDMIFEFSREE